MTITQCIIEITSMVFFSQCLGESEVGAKGDLLHDSHAEVVAKRAFQLYLIDQIRWIWADNLNLHLLYNM